MYKMEDCIDRPGVSKVCDFKEFLTSTKCSSLLLKTVELGSRKVLYPLKGIVVKVLKGISKLYQHPDFHTLCEQWRT